MSPLHGLSHMVVVREMTRSTRMSVRPITTSCRMLAREDGKRNYDAATILEDEKKGVFRVIEIGKPKDGDRKMFKRRGGQGAAPPPRSASMTPDQAWGSVWPAPRTFHPAAVPLPVRQGVVQTKAQVVPSKYANAELMKIPNFLHLTPPVISSHCQAISKFCTAWPKGLQTEEDMDEHFPITITTSDYLNSNSSVRDRRARIVQVRLKLDSLPLDSHAKDKMIRLVGDRYNEETGEMSVTSDRCPYRGQNEDYCKYLLTALLHESWRVEDWERKETEDKEVFKTGEEEEGDRREALEALLNVGEDEVAVLRYKEEVRKMLGLPEQLVVPTVVGGEVGGE
eukprot:GFUD01043121.1.p1 GENE.GFUD01043121.1~~GFUD01043121.1.p1  ORF type:complete len:339 (+),score=133.21 GFUD01043121.1:37-1053(+)